MKIIHVVLHQALRKHCQIGALYSYLACLAMLALSLSGNQMLLRNYELAIARDLASQPAQTHQPVPPQNNAKVTFVANIIKHDYPAHPDSERIARIIVAESTKSDIDPLFVAAVIRAESMFRNKAVSHRGAQGLMQLMPKTGEYVAQLSNIELKQISDLHNPETNVKLGIWYLKHLEQRFKGCREKLLVAYNWGPSNLRRALSAKTGFPNESVRYVQKVLSRHALWSKQFAQYAMNPSATVIG